MPKKPRMAWNGARSWYRVNFHLPKTFTNIQKCCAHIFCVYLKKKTSMNEQKWPNVLFSATFCVFKKKLFLKLQLFSTVVTDVTLSSVDWNLNDLCVSLWSGDVHPEQRWGDADHWAAGHGGGSGRWSFRRPGKDVSVTRWTWVMSVSELCQPCPVSACPATWSSLSEQSPVCAHRLKATSSNPCFCPGEKLSLNVPCFKVRSQPLCLVWFKI